MQYQSSELKSESISRKFKPLKHDLPELKFFVKSKFLSNNLHRRVFVQTNIYNLHNFIWFHQKFQDYTHWPKSKHLSQKFKLLWQICRCTDLDSLIGNFDCRYSTVWKLSNFPAPLILCENNFCWFQKSKYCCFNNLESIEFWILQKFHTWKCQKFAKIQNLELLKWSK